MPLPLIIPVVLGAAGIFGAGKAAMAVIDSKEAEAVVKKSKGFLTGPRNNWNSPKLGLIKGAALFSALLAPGFLFYFSLLRARAENKLAEARAGRAQALEYRKIAEGVCQNLLTVQEDANSASRVLASLRERLKVATAKLEAVIGLAGPDFSLYSDQARINTLLAFKHAELVKTVAGTSVLTDSGNLNGQARAIFLRAETDLVYL
ncbi:MAG: hypothetical protein LBP22_07080 [Deltaproteobacteria bacterium]|jgi:hypothetical protein|nr:hypothetical protein [Deltaproteobacteria bacterium]